MALTAYCKKCAREVDVGETCPFCGTRLGKNAAHAAWCVERIPVKDWMSWNALMRILLPAALVILLLVLLAEGISGGAAAVEKMLVSGFPVVLLILLGSILALAFAALLLQAIQDGPGLNREVTVRGRLIRGETVADAPD